MGCGSLLGSVCVGVCCCCGVLLGVALGWISVGGWVDLGGWIWVFWVFWVFVGKFVVFCIRFFWFCCIGWLRMLGVGFCSYFCFLYMVILVGSMNSLGVCGFVFVLVGFVLLGEVVH